MTEPPTVIVILPGALQRLFPGSPRRVELAGSTVDEALDALDARWPGIRDRICDSTPAIRRHINVFVDGERAALDTPLAAGSTVIVLTAVSGG
ncbi:thiamineS protein [alpha proteobacterium BAL199]|jgi:sulfur-carrier protein|nr:thiamineS protein [alpha proteobacterium BAL199]